jgi:hypothetical protein
MATGMATAAIEADPRNLCRAWARLRLRRVAGVRAAGSDADAGDAEGCARAPDADIGRCGGIGAEGAVCCVSLAGAA